MKEQRSHHYDSAAAGSALDLPMFLTQGLRRIRRQPTMPMRPGYDMQRTTFGTAVVKVRAHGDERLKHSHRRLDIDDAQIKQFS